MTDPQLPELDAESVLSVLERHGVKYVMVGGYAARLHGAQRPTRDVDVTPATTEKNLTRLAAALDDLGARIRADGVPEGLPFHASAESLRGVQMLNLDTPHGELDLTFHPAGTAGFDGLERAAVTRLVGVVQVRVAALSDVIRSKEAAGRPKDAEALPELYRLAGRDRGTTTATSRSSDVVIKRGPRH